MARLRGQYDRALELLEASIPFHKQSLEKWPTNPVALDCYFRTRIGTSWNAILVPAGQAAAAATVERLVATFPERLEAYHLGAEQSPLRCAVLAVGGDLRRRAPLQRETGSGEASPSRHTYRQRAHELIAKAPDAPQRTPDTVDRFAWFLLTCEDKSFRDAPRALELAKSVVKDAPERRGVWFTLALAHYRNWRLASGRRRPAELDQVCPRRPGDRL